MINFLDPKLLSFIGKNRQVFLLVVLLGANIYQYVQGKQDESSSKQTVSELNQKIEDIQNEDKQYERERSEKLQLLLTTFKNSEDGKDH